MPLTDTRLRALKPKDKPYKVTDERGLYVEVTPTGSKLWRFRYRIGGAQKKLCIGSYPEISLKQARDAAYEARRAVASGGDPAFEKRKRKIRAEFLSAQTFEAVAREYIEQMMVQNGRADGTIVKANYFLDKLAPAIGNRPIHEIEPFEVLAPLKRLEATGKHETAKKCRSFAGRVFRYGVATTRCKSDPTSMLKGALVTPRAKHYAAILEPTELGGLLRAIDDFTGYMVTKFALQIAPHVGVRCWAGRAVLVVMDGTFRGIEHQSAMRSLYVLSSPRSRAVGNRELDFGAANQAKSDIWRCAGRDSRRLIAKERRLCRLLSEASRDTREYGRNSRELSKEADSFLPPCSLDVLFVFLQASFAVSGESFTSRDKDSSMTNMALFAEQQVRADLARLLLAAVEASGRARCDIARDAQIHKDALRRVLAGERSASLGEALRILAASGVAPHAHLLLFLVSSGDHAIAWLQSDLAQFFEDFSGELPSALERVLGNQVHDVKPRWAKGTAHRVARLLSDHIDELERKDALLGDVFAGVEGGHRG